MSGNVHRFKSEPPPAPAGFVETDTARAILRALHRARAKEKMTLIAGAPGIGKSRALHRFHDEAPDMLIHSAISGEGGVYNVARALCGMLGLCPPKSSDLSETRRRLAEAIGAGGFVAIDEAQYLVQRNPKGRDDTAALEWVRALSEEGCFGVALVGDMSLVHAIAELPQLDRRTHPRVVVPVSEASDVAAFCAARGLTEKRVIDRIATKARRFGGLGYVAEILSDARDFSDTGVPSAEDFYAAMQMFEEGCR